MHSPREFSDDFVDTWIPVSTSIKIWKRSSRVDYIWDTNGSYEGFLFNAEKLGLIDENGDWIGGQRRLILLGDVFGDRNMESFLIAIHVNTLLGQWADIDCLAGNHDDMALGYFDTFPTGRDYVGFRYFQAAYFSNEWPRIIDIFKGVQEFWEFGEDSQWHTSWQRVLLRLKPHNILSEMRWGQKWQDILRYLCNMQVGKIIDDTLFIHTDPTDAMVDMLETYDWDIEKINDVFRSFLLQTLMQWDYSDTETIEKAMKIRTVFLDSFNRRHDDKTHQIMFSETKARALKQRLKIRRIIHGHTDHMNESPPEPQTIYRWWIEITSADKSSFRHGDLPPHNTFISAGSILQNGHRIEPRPRGRF